jgi:hypothetical protein
VIDQRAKRAACLIASQLPDDDNEAMMVLRYAADIVRHLQADTEAANQLSTAARKGLAIAPEDAPANLNDFRDRANRV